MARQARIIFEAETGGARVKVQQLDTTLEDLEKGTLEAGQAFDKAEDEAKDFGNAVDVFLGNVAADAVAALTRGVQDLARNGMQALNDSIEFAGIQDILDRRLEQAILNTGAATEEWLPRLKDVANELQRTSNFTNEQAQAGQALLLSFREVGGPQGAEMLTRRLADLAAGAANTTGQTMDLTQAAQIMGRAMTQGVGALSRVGISLSDAQEEAFNAAEGMERVAFLAEIVDSNFKGMAEATRDPLQGLENAWDDLIKQFGQELLPVIHQVASDLEDLAQNEEVLQFVRDLAQFFAKTLKEAVEETAHWFQENEEAVRDLGRESKQLVIELKELWKHLNRISAVLGILPGGFNDMEHALNRQRGLMHAWNKVLGLANAGAAGLEGTAQSLFGTINDGNTSAMEPMNENVLVASQNLLIFQEALDATSGAFDVPGLQQIIQNLENLAGAVNDGDGDGPPDTDPWEDLIALLDGLQGEKWRRDLEALRAGVDNFSEAMEGADLDDLDISLDDVPKEIEDIPQAAEQAGVEINDMFAAWMVSNKEMVQDMAGSAGQALSQVGQFMSNLHGQQLEQIRAEKRQRLSSIQERLENERLSERQRQDLLEERASVEEEYEKKAAEQREKRAKMEKRMGLLRIAVETAKNLVEAFPDPLRMGTAAALGAAQAAVIASKPIPQFAHGVDGAPGGLAIVGEQGPELMTVGRGQNVISNERIQQLAEMHQRMPMGGGFDDSQMIHELRALRADTQQQTAEIRSKQDRIENNVNHLLESERQVETSNKAMGVD